VVQFIISEIEHPVESTRVSFITGATLNCNGSVNVIGAVVPLPTYVH